MIDPIQPFESEALTTNALLNGTRLTTRNMPSKRAPRGGDWCEAFAVSDDVVAISIGDVCGHGVEKYDAMIAVRQAIRDAVHFGLYPAQALAAANRFLRGYDPNEYATAILALLSTRNRSLAFANAGHPAPLMTNALGTMFLEFAEADLPLGIEDEIVPALRVIGIPAATLLVFYTDGVSEHERLPLKGALELRDASIVALTSPLLSAGVIEEQMALTGINRDDASILTARTPRTAVMRHPQAKRRT